MPVDPSLGLEGIMLTLVQIPSSVTSSQETASLVADYLKFDRQRVLRRQYVKAFGGMAIIVLLGVLFGRVDPSEGESVAALLLLVPAVVVAAEWLRWRRLVKRLDNARVQAQAMRKS